MDKELIETLSNLFDEKLKPIMEGQEQIRKDVHSILDQTALLTEFKTEVNMKLDRIEDDLNNVEIITSKNWNDIARLKSVK